MRTWADPPGQRHERALPVPGSNEYSCRLARTDRRADTKVCNILPDARSR
jgi:hypothetical protein